jgi:uncharacterized protein
MSIGLIALLDDVTALAKIAAASLDDVAGQAARAGVKAAGVVIDDTAVTPRYVIGLAPARELPIVGKIALGSLRNKLLFLLPAALALSMLAPWAITPLLMLGGAYLCYEGTEKIYEAVFPRQTEEHEAGVGSLAVKTQTLEDEKVASAIKTDLILSAEIMAITLAAVPASGFWMQAAVLAIVGLGITVAVYGGVALIVKADDLGMQLAKTHSASFPGILLRAVGRALVLAMPTFLNVLALVGTVAMIWVGGGIIIHGLELYGLTAIGHAAHAVAVYAARALAPISGMAEWIVMAFVSGVIGVLVGAALIPAASYVFAPIWTRLKEKLQR